METKQFPTGIDTILTLVDDFDPSNYARTRNFLSGGVSQLSPYISRGVISTKYVLHRLLERGFDPKSIEKFIQELAWRDHWQLIWKHQGMAIDRDLRHPQPEVENHGIADSIVSASTGINCIDSAIKRLYNTGYMHNHARMYVAMLATNIGKSHWSTPAKWMYYHLLDGDWASNALSWQWVAGSNSNKKYLANQDNLNKYCDCSQRGTFLDTSYEELSNCDIPDALRSVKELQLSTTLPPVTNMVQLDNDLPTAIYNWYNLDPLWRADEKLNRILLLEPAVFEQYPISESSISFMLELSRNIENIQIFAGNYDDFIAQHRPQEIVFKEHPLNTHYSGMQDERDWMFKENGMHRSFFSFWKKCRKELYP